MPGIRLTPQTRFLLLGSTLVAGLLVLWWLVLTNPLLFLLREAVGVCGGVIFSGDSTLTVSEVPGGNWTFEVPLQATLPRSPANRAPRRIRSMDVELARSDVAAFTFGLPVYWALILAAPGIRRCLRPLAAGTVAMAGLEIILLLITAKILAHKSLAQLLQSQSPIENWFLRFGGYLVVITRYLLPFVVAICVYRELREQMFHWASPALLPAEGAATPGWNGPRKLARIKKHARKRV